MTSYTSGKRTEEGLPLANHDPEPWYVPHNGLMAGYRTAADERYAIYSPRPKFDVPDNPILVYLRQYNGLTQAHVSEWLNAIATGKRLSLNGALVTPEQIDHARRVLTKRAVLA